MTYTVSDHPTTVVLANGDYPTHPVPLRLLQQAELVVCCDGAANRYIPCAGPTVVVGDGDSLSDRYRPLLRHVGEQETNDLTKAVDYLLHLGERHIAIVGATGGREDHTLGNVSLLIDYLRRGVSARLYTNHGVFIPCRGDVVIPSYAGQQVSVFSFGASDLRGQGLRYPLRDFTNWWQGTLNEALGPEFRVFARGYYLIFCVY